MTNAEMKAEVKRMLLNMQDSDIYVTSGAVQKWVNDGVTSVVRMGLEGLKHDIDLFPELRTTWLSDLTLDGISRYSLPADKLVILKMATFRKATLPSESADKTYPMEYRQPHEFDEISKESRTGWPIIWTMIGHAFKVWPTPSAASPGYTSYQRIYGIQMDPYPAMSADADTPILNPMWHDTCVNRAAAIGAAKKGWWEQSKMWNGDVAASLGFSVNIGAAEDAAQQSSVSVDGMPMRADVYGR